MYGMLTRWRRAERMLCRERGCEPTFDEVADHLGLTDLQTSLVAKARRASQLKLESSLSDEDRSWTADRTMDSVEGPEAALELSDDRREVLRRLDRLDERERLVVSLRFGLDGDSPLTLREIGRRLGVTREWVRKIELRAIGKLVATEQASASAQRPRRSGRPARPAAPRTPALPSLPPTTGSPGYPARLPLKHGDSAAIAVAAAG
jgi:RNA polymerase primary sigma factor